MNKAFRTTSKPSINWSLKPDKSEEHGEPNGFEDECLAHAAMKTPGDDAWKSSALALELIDYLKGSNAQRH